MPKEIQIAICLVMVFEGLLLFAAPQAWQNMVKQMGEASPQQIRTVGGMILIVGLIAFEVVRH